MNRTILALGLLLLLPAAAFSQAGAPPPPPMPMPSPSGTAPQIAFDIPKTDIDTLLKNAPPAVDQALRVVDMGKYNLEVGIIHRGKTNDKPGDPIAGPYNILNGPGGNETATAASYSRKVGPGDIIIIPPGVLHAWSQITDQVTYLSVRPDPDRVLPGGYVNPLLLKAPPTAIPPPAK